MTRNRFALLAWVVGWMMVTTSAFAAAVTVPVSDDASVNGANPSNNLNAVTTRGGLFSGLDDTGSDYQFFLKFNLPAPAGTVTSAKLVGTYTEDFGDTDSFHQIYFVPSDAWSEASITFDTKPATAEVVDGGFDAAGHQPGDTVEYDITSVVKRELAGDGVLSLNISTIDGRLGDLEYFASKEFDASKAFRIELTTSATAVPLPPAAPAGAALLAASLGGIFIATRRRIARI